MIEEIYTSSEDKNEAYRLMVMIHKMAMRCALANIDGWEIKSTCTDADYCATVVTNSIVDIRARTIGGDKHFYEMLNSAD